MIKEDRMKQFSKVLILASFLVLFSLTCTPPESGNTEYKELHDFIWETQFVDVHSHPEAGPVKYDGNDYYPTLQPYITRPYFPINKEQISVTDALEVEALKALYGYTKDDVTEADLPELEQLHKKFWEPGNVESFNKAMDICGIDKVFANLPTLGEDLDPERFLWIPWMDALIYPFDASDIKSISPFFKQGQNRFYNGDKNLPK